VAERQRGMGRGLAAILSAPSPRSDEPAGDELREVAVAAVAPNPDQPRQRFDEQALAALADSVRERGVLQPVLVRAAGAARYELIAGERRWRAAQLAGLATIPAIVRADGGDGAALELALIENMVREDLNPVEQARACATLVEDLGLTREAVGLRVGRSRAAISNLVRLLDLPDDALDLMQSGALSEGHGRALLLATDHDDRRRLAVAAAENGWSVRELESRARRGAAPRRRGGPRALHPDQEEASARASDALGAALGRDVAVRPHGAGYRATVQFASVDEALELAERVAGEKAAGAPLESPAARAISSAG
jgi:ParB family transcriptional regulator, chromosome partitioning protein